MKTKAVILHSARAMEAVGAPAALLVAGLMASSALAEGDAAHGEKLFKQCIVCHTIGEGQPSRIGPNLHGVIGRTVGSAEKFRYSKPYQEAHDAGKVWTPEDFLTFIADPRKVYAPSRMVLAIKDQKDREDLLAFLLSNSPGYDADSVATGDKPAK